MLACPACSTPIPGKAVAEDGATPCAGCRGLLRVEAFPRLLEGVDEGNPPEPVVGDEAACFVHPGNRAAVPCSGCGRYLCTLCDLQLDGRHLCPTCLEAGLVDPERLVRERVLWNRVVWSLAILPLLIFYFTVITAPTVLVLAVVKRRAPGSLVRRGRAGLWVGAAIAALQVVGWIALVGFLVAEALK